jgi:hypothetical protein
VRVVVAVIVGVIDSAGSHVSILVVRDSKAEKR